MNCQFTCFIFFVCLHIVNEYNVNPISVSRIDAKWAPFIPSLLSLFIFAIQNWRTSYTYICYCDLYLNARRGIGEIQRNRIATLHKNKNAFALRRRFPLVAGEVSPTQWRTKSFYGFSQTAFTFAYNNKRSLSHWNNISSDTIRISSKKPVLVVLSSSLKNTNLRYGNLLSDTSYALEGRGKKSFWARERKNSFRVRCVK